VTSTKSVTTEGLEGTAHTKKEAVSEGHDDREGNRNGRELQVSKMANKD